MPRAQLPNQMAVHSAVIGHTDIVRLMLEADNSRDLNTRAYHTKETLAHLAVKHDHRKFYDLLAGLGADLRIKDASGKNVFDLTTGLDWKQTIIETTLAIEHTQQQIDSTKDREALFQRLNEVRAEKLRKSTKKQRDQERASANIPKSTTARSSPATAAPVTAQLLGTSGSQPPQASSEALLATGSAFSKKKKKQGKKGKKKSRQESVEATIATTEAIIDVDDTPNLMKDLLFHDAVDEESDHNSDSEQKASFISQLPEKFARLNGTSLSEVPAASEAKDIYKTARTLMDAVELLAMKDRVNTTRRSLRVQTASEVTQTIHLMQKFHSFDHKPHLATALAPLRELAGTTVKFTKFVIEASQLLGSVERKPQARKLLDLLRKRMLGLRVRSQWF